MNERPAPCLIVASGRSQINPSEKAAEEIDKYLKRRR